MAKFAQGIYTPKNPEKYVGKHAPKYRSGWEMTFMTFCDSNKNVLYWASEAIKIPYRSPLDGKIHQYIPDFFVVYQNKNGKQIAEIVEIKPKKQSLIESRVASARDRAGRIVGISACANDWRITNSAPAFSSQPTGTGGGSKIARCIQRNASNSAIRECLRG